MCESIYEGDRCELLKAEANCNGRCGHDEACSLFNGTYVCMKVVK